MESKQVNSADEAKIEKEKERKMKEKVEKA